MTSRLRARFQPYPDAVGLGALALLALWAFWPLLFGGQALFFGDLELYFYPQSEFWRRELIEGRLPLWNPHLSGGVPFAGNPQMGLLYPPSILLGLFPAITAISLGLVLHLWCGAGVLFCWLRRGRLQLSTSASLLGAVCWMLGGTFVSKTQFPNMLAALAWLPAVLWATENLAQRPQARAIATLGVALGLQLLAAHAQVSLYTLYLAFFYTLWGWKTTAQRAAFWKMGAAFLAACALALLLDAGQILPVLESLRGAERQVLSIETAPRFFLPPWATTNLFAPYLYGNPNSGTWTFRGGGNAWETACHLGIVPFLLALLAFKKGRFWTAVAVISLLLAMGPWGRLYLLAYNFLPGIARFHDAARFLMLTGLAFSILAALGLQKMRDWPKARRWVPFLLLVAALDLGFFARNFYPIRDKAALVPAAHFTGFNDAFLNEHKGRVWCANPKAVRGLFLDYGNYGHRTAAHEAQFPPIAIPNQHMRSGLMEAEGYDPIAPALVTARLKALEIADDATRFPDNYAQRLGQSNIRLLSVWREKPLSPAPGLVEIYRGSQAVKGKRLFVYRNDLCPPRAQWRSEDGNWSAAKLSVSGANSVEVEVPQSATELKLADNFAPGWTAHEAGGKLEMSATTEGFRRVKLKSNGSAGQRQIRFDYVPSTWKFGVFVSLCALCFVIAVGVSTRRS